LESDNRLDHLRTYFQKYSQDVEESLDFLEWFLKKKPLFGKPSISWKNAVFRIVYGGFNPLSVAGSFATGGRFNIGGAQINPLFPNFTMQACLYAGSTIECARKEAGLGINQEYRLTPKKSFKLWDLELLIEEKLTYSSLKSQIDSTPLAAIWALQKVPKVSQILAYYLRKKGGDGLIYLSTKDSKGKVLAFFAKDDDHVKRCFQAQPL